MKTMTVPLLLALFAATAEAQIINIDATRHGEYPGGPFPAVGDVVTPFTNPSGLPLIQLTLGPGQYEITNAAGQPGSDLSLIGWNFNVNAGGWVWKLLLVDDATKKVVFHGLVDYVFPSQAALAADPRVQGYKDRFELKTTTTIDFMITDYYLPDNAGGMSVKVSPVPEPRATGVAVGCLSLGALLLRGRRAKANAC